MIEAPEPGVYPDIPNEDYHRWHGAVNSSLLKEVRQLTPGHAYAWLMDPDEQTLALDLGQAMHLACLEPDDFSDKVIQGLEIDRKSNANKAEWAAFEEANAGQIILPHHEFSKVEDMARAVRAHPLAMQLLDAPGHQELSIVWKDEVTGLKCKSRLDRLSHWKGHNAIIELKTVRERLTNDAIDRIIGKWLYDLSAAFYLDGAAALAPAERRFFFIFVEKGKTQKKGAYRPQLHGVRVAEANATVLYEGRHKYQRALKQWAECVESEDYPVWGNEIYSAGLKPWDQVAEREMNEEYENGE